MSITFSCPTWNRAAQLDRCMRSIAEQIKVVGNGCSILICDHGSTDSTAEVITQLCADYPFIRRDYLENPPEHSYQQNFQFAFGHPSIDTEWTWCFGDDDLLLPNALQWMLNLLQDTKAEFIHVAEIFRAGPKLSGHKGTLLQLCNKFGWLDMTSFITCNVVRTKRLRSAVNLPSWNLYGHCSFAHSCALLEELHADNALFIDLALVDAQEQTWNGDKDARWVKEKIAKRYFYVNEGLQDMAARGVLPKTLPLTFFRYHSYYLWDRFISNQISQYSNHPDDPQPELWDNISGLASLLDGENRPILEARIREVRAAISKHFVATRRIAMRSTILSALSDDHNTEKFGMAYLGEPKPREEPSLPPAGRGIDGLTNLIWQAQKRQRAHDVATCTSLSTVEYGELAALCATAIKNSRLADFQAQEEKAA